MSREPRTFAQLLDNLEITARTTVDQARQFIEGLSPAQRTWQPDRKAWSIAQCFEHLIVTDGLYISRIREALAQAPEAAPDSIYHPGWFGKLFVRSAGPEGFKIKAFRIFQPDDEVVDAASVDRFCDGQPALLDLLRSAQGRDLNAVEVASPQSRFLSLRVGAALEMLVLHQQRHLQQAERVVAELEELTQG